MLVTTVPWESAYTFVSARQVTTYSESFILMIVTLSLTFFCLLVFLHLHTRLRSIQNDNCLLSIANQLLCDTQVLHLQNSQHFARTMLKVIDTTETEIARIEHAKNWQGYQQKVSEQSQSLRNISQSLLTLSPLTVRQPIPLDDVLTHEIVDESVQLFSVCCGNKGQTLRISNQTCSIVHLPRGLLQKLIRRLMLNALMHANAKDPIVITSSTVGGYFYFSVENYGGGISMQRLSEAFKQRDACVVNNNTQQIIDGETPLTLKKIVSLVRQFRGNIEIKSALYYSTKLTLSFPSTGRYPIEKSTSIMLYPSQIRFVDQRSKQDQLPRVMIMCDTQDVAVNLEVELQSDFRCQIAQGFRDGMHMLNDFKPDFILVEHRIYQLGSIEIINLLASMRKKSEGEAAIVLLFPLNDKESHLNLLRQGISSVITPPYNVKEVKLTLQNLHNERQKYAIRVDEAIGAYHSKQLNTPDPDDFSLSRQQRFVQNFNRVIDENFHRQEFTRRDAAALLAIEIRTLNRRLAECFQHNFLQHLRKFRLTQAKTLILSGDSISEACYAVGFNNPSHFSTAFKKEFGITPSRLISS